jgi:diadenosine tetraphosphate (Ap4A) HIT family hydrolase
MLNALMRLARTELDRILARWSFIHMSFAIPVKRLHETENRMAFFHPKPAYAFHVVLVSKRAVRDLAEPARTDTALFFDLFSTFQALVDGF